MECYIHEGKRFTSDWSDHASIIGGSVRVETEENKDMFDENDEGYKGRKKPFMNNKKLDMKE